MAIFKKTPIQGNFILSNGQQALFDAKGFFETEDEHIIEQLKSVYKEVKEREEAKPAKAAQSATPGKTGMGTSATLMADLTKASTSK